MTLFAHVESLRAGAVSSIRFGLHFDAVTICSDGSSAVSYTVDGSTPVIGAGNQLAAGAPSEVYVLCPAGPTVVSLVSGGNPVCSVAMGRKSTSRPPHAASFPATDW